MDTTNPLGCVEKAMARYRGPIVAYVKSTHFFPVIHFILKFVRSLELILRHIAHNLYYLCVTDLRKVETDMRARSSDQRVMSLLAHCNPPKIKTHEETIDDIIRKKASMCRFGDGEFFIISDEKGAQVTDDMLNNNWLKIKLKSILCSDDENILIAIPYTLFYHRHDENEYHKSATCVRAKIKGLRIEDMISFLSPGKQYYDSLISWIFRCYSDDYDYEYYFDKCRKIWDGRDVTFVCGESHFVNLKYNIFDNCGRENYIYVTEFNAFNHYDEIFKEAKKINKSDLVIIMLGPTAKILAYDLAKLGYQALDIGSIADDYDHYKSKKEFLKSRKHMYK